MKTRIMVLNGGSPAMHKLGNIGRKDDSFIIITDDKDDQYIGQFAEGFGFVHVEFNKSDVRPCTKEEIDKLNGCYFCVNSNALYQNHYNYEGFWVSE